MFFQPLLLAVPIATALSVIPDHAPPWSSLEERATSLLEESIPSQLLHDDETTRVTFYRDSAAWCPYCQRVWLLLEEEQIPYRVEKVPLNAYGDKPVWFTRKVDGGKLPALDLDGELYTESVDIMHRLLRTFSEKDDPSIEEEENQIERTNKLMELEEEVQRAWFSLVFYPVRDDALEKSRENLLIYLKKVDAALNTTEGPWFMEGGSPSWIDMYYIPTFERLISSSLYYKGLDIRRLVTSLPALNRWLACWDDRPSYRACKSDDYTLAMTLPSQNGPGYFVKEQAGEISDRICGLNGAWDITAVPDNEDARHEAALALMRNHESVVLFACRGAGEPGTPSYHAELADPYAEPNLDFAPAVDICLRHVTVALMEGVLPLNATLDLVGQAGDGTLRTDWEEYNDEDGSGVYYWNEITGDSTWTPPTQQLDTCLAYLRDRIGVPRDMSETAAMQLRAHLNWAIGILQTSKD